MVAIGAVSGPLRGAATGAALDVDRGRTQESHAFHEVLVRSLPDRGALVTSVRTGLSSDQARSALTKAWASVFGEEPPPGAVGILKAQWAHETAGGSRMYNYNFGGIKGAGPEGFSVAQHTREGSGESERRIVDRFRAYSTAEDGATDYVKLLSARYPDAIAAAKQGNAPAFVHALKAHGYFTGDEGTYTRSVVALSGASAGAAGAPDDADSPRLDYSTLAAKGGPVAPAIAFADGGARGLFVDPVAMTDELSRTALRIATDPDHDRRPEAT